MGDEFTAEHGEQFDQALDAIQHSSSISPDSSLSLRDAIPTDAETLCAIYNTYVGDGSITFDGDLKTPEFFRAQMQASGAREPWVVLEDSTAILGYGRLFLYSDRCGYKTTGETSVYLATGQSRRGYGSLLKAELIRRAVAHGYHHLVAKIVAGNAASLEYNLRFGYELVGTQRQAGWVDGQWKDVVILQLVLDTPPPEM